MAEPLAITILRKKRDRIRDTIARYEARLREAQADLAHVIAGLRLFEIDSNADDFPADVDLNRVFRRGETTSRTDSYRRRSISTPGSPENSTKMSSPRTMY
jgi:hypothetical protein